MTRRRLAVGLTMLLASASPLTAQETGLNLVPYVGYYVPVGNLMEFQVLDNRGPVDVSVNHETQFLVGARFDMWFSRTWGAEGNFGYTWSDVHVEATSGNVTNDDLCANSDVDCDGSVWLASARGLYRSFFGRADRSSFHASAGLVVVGRGGEFYDSVEGSTDVGAVFGVGFAFHASRATVVTLDVENYIYSFAGLVDLEADGQTIQTESRLQNEIVFSLGVQVPLSQ